MKGPKTVFLPLIFMILGSCELFTGPDNTSIPSVKGKYWAQHMVTGKYYQLEASKLYEGKYCAILAEDNPDIIITTDQAKAIADEFDTKIYQSVVENFSMKNFIYGGIPFKNIMECASRLVGKWDGKLTILLLDIQDSYAPPDNMGYVAGYFSAANFYDQKSLNGTGHHTNLSSMIYVDTNPGLKDDLENTYSTLAHELQHLINFVTTVCLDRDFLTDTWIDEGLSSQAEFLYLGELESRIKYYNDDPKGTIARGNNFFVWDNYPGDSILDEYATVYLFFRWLYLQTGEKPNIFYDIETSLYSDQRAVTGVFQKINPPNPLSTWETLLRTWLAANYINHPDNQYGYKSKPLLNEIKAKTTSGVLNKVNLYPGEGVYSLIDNTNYTLPGDSGANIRYAGLDTASITTHTNPSDPYTGDALLTFNTNTPENNYAISAKDREPGFVTGFGGNTKTLFRSGELTGSGPWVIDAGDALGRQWPKIFPAKDMKNE
jgi:hypothetical protein